MSGFNNKKYDCRRNATAYDVIRGSYHANIIHMQYGDEDKQVPPKRHFVLWSGGCDSTLLLYELLEAYGSDNVIAVTYIYPWLDTKKVESERSHREAFKEKISSRGEKFKNINHVEITVTWQTSWNSVVRGRMDFNAEQGGATQMLAWLLMLPMNTVSGDVIYTALIKGDDSPLYLREYQNIIDNMGAALERDLKVRLPYLFLTKADVITKLIEYDIYDTTWSCEMPIEKDVKCETCHPCITHRQALGALMATTIHKKVYDVVKQELDTYEKERFAKEDKGYLPDHISTEA